MSYVLRKEETETLTITMKGGIRKRLSIPIKPALCAQVRAACGKKFQMRDKAGAGRWEARMDGCPGRLGNMHHLDCCSYSCAGDLSNGKWKKPLGDKLAASDARQYSKAKCDVESSEFSMGWVMYEEDLIEEWESISRAGIQIGVTQKFSDGTCDELATAFVLE